VTVSSNLSKIISFVTSKGFQIHPDALFLIEKIQDDYFQIIEDILSGKRKRKEESMVIITDDIKKIVKDSSFTISTENNNKSKLIVSEAEAKAEAEHDQYYEDKELLKEDSSVYSADKDRLYKHREKTESFKIVYDSNDKINSGEGVEGYASLFRSRYEKSLKILSLRQDSKKVKKIETIKNKFPC
jgi:DNA polymerase II small subunit